MNHYPRHVGDWMRDTAHLSEVEECIYSRLLDRYYSTEAPLPQETAQCCRLVRATSAAAKKAVASVLAEFFTLEADGWHQKRADRELSLYRERSESARESANARWSNRNAERMRTQSERNANASETHSDGNANHKPVASSQEPVATQVPTHQANSLDASEPSKVKNASGARKPAPAEPAKGAETWSAYSSAFQARYGVEPVRNRKANALISQFVDRLGVRESPPVAAHFLRSNRQLYVASRHALDLLIRDAEAIRTDWATGVNGTETQARQADRTAATGNTFGKLIEEARNGTAG